MNSEKTERKEEPKKPYTSPTLVVYGSVSKLTKGGTGGSAEGSMITDLTKHP
jgi:hypothetical protein